MPIVGRLSSSGRYRVTRRSALAHPARPRLPARQARAASCEAVSGAASVSGATLDSRRLPAAGASTSAV
ncbi:hypothetical protein AQ965_06570 [Burkholderia pseudomallei]|uniref:Uncharacterized protein n=2 Tax=Burkholderia pseudomallei TaxID=28450 RepID=Q3JN69_BURP1|nr:hypothetical protein BURPS1710b_3619 [Burkholderia pseudomallei 1710b]ANW57756.1 hypothetical protein A7U59_17695 [Burkholderia pseudomallei]EDO93801.1 conserved hypothetical protein [Burkholderia pseudomallei Pasteur 52237]EET08014.1 conserved hypothetical protein [Burkholderia pseudomallei 1710a]KYZ83945.1 hypothetical protein PTBPS01_18195 [Burkholderia pseudomallei]